jgi:hypothetical protein
VQNDNAQVFTFTRYQGNKRVVVAVNLSAQPQQAVIHAEGATASVKVLYGSAKPVVSGDGVVLSLPAYGIEVWE